MKISTILIPIDFSSCSINALEYALDLNMHMDAKVVLVNCYTPEQPMAEMKLRIDPEIEANYHRETEKKIQELENEVTRLQILDYNYIIKMRFIPDGIAEAAEDCNADLIIMGTRGTNKKLQSLFGSNAYAVIKNSKVPVLAIPAGAKFKAFNRIVLCADYKEIENTNPLEIVREFTTFSDGHLQILHFRTDGKVLNDSEREELLSMSKFFSGRNIAFFHSGEKMVADGLEKHLKAHHNDLIVTLHRKHFFAESVFKQKVTKHVVQHSSIPVLALPELEELMEVKP